MQDLTTTRLLLKHPKQTDVNALLSFYEQNKEHFEPTEAKRSSQFYTHSYQLRTLLAEISLEASSTYLRYYLSLKSNPISVIGAVSVTDIKQGIFCSCTLGYKLDLQYCHQGYATEAVAAVIDHLIRVYHMHRIEAYILPDNQASIDLVNRLGFSYDGICSDYAKINGRWRSHERYVLLCPEDS